MLKKKKTSNKKLIYGIILLLGLMLGYSFYDEISRFAIKTFYRIYNSLNLDEVDQSKNLKNFGIPIPSKYTVHGIDISRYQNKINWKEVKKMKVDSIKINFVYIKASEGKTRIDRYFDFNWENAKKHNLIRGAYHFYRPQVNSKLQADNFISNVKLEKGDLPPVLDIELLATGYHIDNTVKGLKNWLKIVENHYHIKPIIYTNIDFYNKYLANKGFDSYPLWIAHYYEKKVKLNQRWHFWQHNDKGKVNGIKGDVDFNVFNGDLHELKALCKK
jgi:lysozyme